MPHSKAFYAGVKFARAHPKSHGLDNNPNEPGTKNFLDWLDGHNRAEGLRIIEACMDPSQLSLEEMQEFAQQDEFDD